MDNTNNQAQVSGVIADEFVFNHEIYAEKFYTFTLSIPRLSGTDDAVRVMVSERLLAGENFSIGDTVDIDGQFRSYNNYEPSGDNRLVLTIFAKDIKKSSGERLHNPNTLYLNGFICKTPVYRTTPFGREITDLLIAVNRSYNKSDYIPVIAWGRNARYAKTLSVGDNVKVWGRIQSRNYQKRLSDDEVITKTAYEVSVNRMELVEKNAPKSPSEGSHEDAVSTHENHTVI